MHQYRGKMILHTGSMFSGKTSSLWKDINRFKIAGYETVVFKPKIDTRYEKEYIISHDKNKMLAYTIDSYQDIEKLLKTSKATVIGIDEIQFLEDDPRELTIFLETLLAEGYTLVVAGLDMDFEAQAFETIKELLPKADYLTKHHAVCASCGNDAWVSFRTSTRNERIQIGAEESYEPLCRACYMVKRKEQAARKDQIKIID